MIAALIADLVNIPVRCWLVILGCVVFLGGYAVMCAKGDCDD